MPVAAFPRRLRPSTGGASAHHWRTLRLRTSGWTRGRSSEPSESSTGTTSSGRDASWRIPSLLPGPTLPPGDGSLQFPRSCHVERRKPSRRPGTGRGWGEPPHPLHCQGLAALLAALADFLRLVLQAGRHLLRLLLTTLLRGVRSGAHRVLGHRLAAVERLLTRLLHLLGHLVGDLAELLVLDAGLREERADDEADRCSCDREPDRVFLGDTDLRRAALHLLTVRDDAADAGDEGVGSADDSVLAARDLADERVLLVGDRLLHAALHVGLVAERFDGLAHALARLLYFVTDLVGCFAHSTSSLTDSIVCRGAGDPASSTFSLPCR